MKRSRNFLIAATALSALLAAIVLIPQALRAEKPALIWTAINVNSKNQQADANLLQIGDEVNILIDAGHILYANDLLQFLRDKHIRHFRAIIISHAHNDHYGALPYLLRNGITAEAVYFNPPARELIEREYWGGNMDDIEEIRQECAERGIPVLTMTDSTEWLFGNDVSMHVLYIFDGVDTPVGTTDINDTSAIIMLKHGKMKYLFPGDLNRALGEYITDRANAISIKADVLKVPHHGAEGLADDSFFHAVNPQAMIVPAPSDLWLSDRCARVRNLASTYPAYVNGLHGHITVQSFGDRFEITTSMNP